MKKLITILLTLSMIFGFCITANAQTYEKGKVYVEGSSKAYDNGDTITVRQGQTFHIARVASELIPINGDFFWYSCWNPDPLEKAGFVIIKASDGADGSAFYNCANAWGPTIYVKNVKTGTYNLHFHFASPSDVAENDFSGAKEYDPIDIKIKVTAPVAQSLTVRTAVKTVKYRILKSAAQKVKPVTSIRGAKTKLTYTKASGSKYLTVNSKNGTVTVKAKTPKGTYKAKIKITAVEENGYKKAVKAVTVTIKVK